MHINKIIEQLKIGKSILGDNHYVLIWFNALVSLYVLADTDFPKNAQQFIDSVKGNYDFKLKLKFFLIRQYLKTGKIEAFKKEFLDLDFESQGRKITISSQPSLYFSFLWESAVNYFMLNDLRKALGYLNKIFLNNSHEFKNERKDLIVKVKLLQLLIYLEKEDVEFLSKQLQHTEAEFKLINYYPKQVKIILNGIKELCKAPPFQRSVIYEKLQKEFSKSLAISEELKSQFLLVFDFSMWIESKIRKISMLDIIKERAVMVQNN